MKGFICGIILCAIVVIVTDVAAEPEPAKGLRGVFSDNSGPQFRAVMPDIENESALVDEVADDDSDVNVKDTSNTNLKSDSSSGRLFLRKFLLFRNIFGNSNSQPVIPIIITGAGNAGTNPTTTVTSTGTVPTATGTITTTPTAKSNSRAGYQNDDEDDDDETAAASAYDDEAANNAAAGAAADEQALQAALAAGAQEYVVTDADIRGTADSKLNTQPNRINLRRKNGRKGQIISVRIPPQYRRYFKSGQRVMVNAANRPNKRRVIRKRVNANRRRVNKNKNKKNKRIIAV